MSSNTCLFLLILLYLIFPLHHPTEAAVIEDRRKPWSNHDLQQIGNALLESDKLVASFLDKVELSVSIPPDSSNKSLSYLIGKNQQFGLTITPCTGPLDGIHFHSTNTAKDGWQNDQSVFSAWTSRSRRSTGIFPSLGGRFWYRPPLRVEPLFLDGDLELHKILKGPNWLKGSGTARLHFSSWGTSGDTLVVTLYARPGTTFRVRWSAKRAFRYRPLQGYPFLPQSSKASLVDACRVNINSTDYLNIRWPPAINEDGSMVYCVAVNSERSLLHHCSLQPMFSNKKDAQKANLVYECTKVNHLQLRLPYRLSQWQAEGHKLYINVYAINSSTNLSSSFTPLVMHSLPLCLQRRPVTRVWVKLRPVTYVLHWLNDIAFDWPRNFHDAAMFLQPCLRPRNREFLYNLEILQQKELGKHKSDQPIASTLIRNRPLLDLSTVTQHFNSDSGLIRIRLSPLNETAEGFLSQGDKVARLFFLNRSATDSLPVRPRTADSSGIPRNDKDLQEVDDDSYPVEFIPQCKMHQITMRMAVSPLPHSYWITTLSIPEASMLHNRNATLAGIAKRINYCEYSNRSLASFLGRQTQIHFQRFTTGFNDTSLNVQLPFIYGEGSPRFYLILVYATRITDVTSAYRSLFLHRLIDACRMVEDNCYATHSGSICA